MYLLENSCCMTLASRQSRGTWKGWTWRWAFTSVVRLLCREGTTWGTFSILAGHIRTLCKAKGTCSDVVDLGRESAAATMGWASTRKL